MNVEPDTLKIVKIELVMTVLTIVIFAKTTSTVKNVTHLLSITLMVKTVDHLVKMVTTKTPKQENVNHVVSTAA
jgi:hypothetical protein